MGKVCLPVDSSLIANVTYERGLPVDHWGPASSHHSPDPASGVEQGQFEAGAAFSIQVGDVGFLQRWGVQGDMVWMSSGAGGVSHYYSWFLSEAGGPASGLTSG